MPPHEPPTHSPAAHTRPGSRLGVARWSAIALFVALALPTTYIKGRFVNQYDEATYHLPTIVRFASTLSHPDLTHYKSATTPLYHLLMATLMRAGCNLPALRLVNLCISVATLIFAMLYFERFARSEATVCLATLVLALNPYMLGPSTRLATDNLALGCAVLILYLLDGRRAVSMRTFLLAVLLSVVAVLTRQLYLWLVPLLCSYAIANAQWPAARRWAGFGVSVLPLIAVAPLFLAWHGFTNPDFAHKHELSGSILTGRALVLAVCLSGTYAMAFAPQLAAILRSAGSGTRRLWIAAATVALVCLPLLNAKPGDFIVPTEGGWLRALAEHTPVVFGHWSLFWILFPVGCAVIAALGQYALATRNGTWLAAAFVLWLIFSVVQARAIAKYYEPFEIIVVGRFAVSAPESGLLYKLPALAIASAFLVMDVARFFLSLPWATPGLAHMTPG